MGNVEQINLKLSKNLIKAARRYAEIYGYKNIQELAADSIRKKIFNDNEFDETFSDKEINLIDNLISLASQKKNLVSEEQINKILLE